MALEASYQRAGVRFLTHDVRTAFDERSDVSRMYNTSRTVPTFLFFVDGAVVGVDVDLLTCEGGVWM